MIANDIITRASTALFDATNVRWSLAELVNYINDGQRQIILFRPDANSVTASLPMVPGSKQTLPATAGTDPNGVSTPTGIRFLRAVRNMGTDGKTPGRAIRECSRVALDNEMPDWHTRTPAAVVQHYIFDNIAPQTFYVYPSIASTPNTYIEMVYSALPTPVVLADISNPTPPNLTLPDSYINPLLDWVLYRSYAKDASYAGNMDRAKAHLEAFGTSLSLGQTMQFQSSAAQQATPTPAAAAQARTGP